MPYGPYIALTDYKWHIHKGHAFFLHETKYGVAASASFALCISTVAESEEEIHVYFGAMGTGGIKMQVFEDVAISTLLGYGTPITPHNHKRASLTAVLASMWLDPLTDKVSDWGTQIKEDWAGANRKVSGTVDAHEEMILSENTVYIINVESAGADNTITGYLHMYVDYS